MGGEKWSKEIKKGVEKVFFRHHSSREHESTFVMCKQTVFMQ